MKETIEIKFRAPLDEDLSMSKPEVGNSLRIAAENNANLYIGFASFERVNGKLCGAVLFVEDGDRALTLTETESLYIAALKSAVYTQGCLGKMENMKKG